MVAHSDVIFLAETIIRGFRIRSFDCIRADANTVDKRSMLVLIRNPIALDLSSNLDLTMEAIAIRLS
ncbi:hypothetical protein ALC56_05779 [Trachymyrmex septentrionalis]|uniref:Uncharacterized protein n=1 Tax=Trachymyrmex septentrionalis TaxID=34720 RepID=A0A151JXT5_9HYME|nr:hypothetical protein ALC56_05779 [Trachymyrmex septentrionalis]